MMSHVLGMQWIKDAQYVINDDKVSTSLELVSVKFTHATFKFRSFHQKNQEHDLYNFV